MWLKEERIIAMMQVVIEILQWLKYLAYLLRNLHMVLEDILERVHRQFESERDIEILAEAIATEVVWMNDGSDILVVLH